MPEKVRCAHILVKTQVEALAVIDRLNKGEDFSKLAAEKSLDGTKRRGGDLGWFGRGTMVKTFEQTAFSLQKGQVSQPVKSEFGWHVIKRLE
ncbi:MAG TPA: peptidylprolyl isomerase [archaeon]|nr:peptidylprolyl isomerase [archaeon]